MRKLFKAYPLSDNLTLHNRIVMSPMTRSRSKGLIANDLNARYYEQRASAGLIVTEGTSVSVQGQGYINIPGIFNDAQATAWRQVTDRVHLQKGVIFAQLWHVGRMSHASFQPQGAAPVSASDLKMAESDNNRTYVELEDGFCGFVAPTPPRALMTNEVQVIEDDFVIAALNANKANFDGVEIHAANGYLFEQFFNPHTNNRTDQYGGSIENRSRFLLETVDKIIDAIGAHKVGVRLSPKSELFDLPHYKENAETYLYLVKALEQRHVVYIHLADNYPNDQPLLSDAYLAEIRALYRGTLILAGGMTLERATTLLEKDLVDLVAFGKPFISNPDLVARLQHNYPLAPSDRTTYYGGDEKGYTDYPFYQS